MSFSKTKQLFSLNNSNISYDDTFEELSAGDFNGDGLLDYLITRTKKMGSIPSKPIFLIANKENIWSDKSNEIFVDALPKVVYPPRIAVADYNNDGQSDVYIPDGGLDAPPYGGALDQLWLSNGKGKLQNFTSTLLQYTTFAHGVAIGDINRDGYLDIVVNNFWYPPSDFLLINNRDGTFSEKANTLLPNELHYDLNSEKRITHLWSKLIDLNNDEYLDLVLGASQDWIDGQLIRHPSILLLNDGNGNYSNSEIINLPSPAVTDLTVVFIASLDFNEDGMQDLIMSIVDQNYSCSYLQFLRNDGDGKFTDETALRLPQNTLNTNSWNKFIKVIDLNGDGYDDIVTTGFPIGSENPSQIGATNIFLNNGLGVFKNIKTFKNYEIINPAVDIKDINSDKKPDIVTVQVSYYDASKTDVNLIGYINDLPVPSNGKLYKPTLNEQTINGSARSDTISYAANDYSIAVDLLKGTALSIRNGTSVSTKLKSIENIIGSRQDDSLNGNSLANSIKGNAGNDTMDGGLGKDSLVGGDGADIFVFSTKPATTNVDTISDYQVGVDKIKLSSKVFAKLKSATDYLTFGTSSDSPTNYLVYDTTSGKLSYDADGSLTKIKPVDIALIGTGLELTYQDFVIA
ncbi:MAG: FG-GAP-like repeat-containing protein [Oxalobacteraceae bacterium]|jgi:hypothetical protein|nr:FG-GAP-like repeat-containing protein [Oxalobacteraceae bacterium]